MQRSAPISATPRISWSIPWRAGADARPTSPPEDGADRVWRILWTPFTTWADAPSPERVQPSRPIAGELGLAGQAVASGIDRIRRRLWATHALAAICRGVWLALVIAAVLMAIDVLGGPVFNPMAAAIAGTPFLLGGIALALLSRPSRPRTARMLDRTFGLQERLTTAIDDLGLGVPAPGERAPVVYLQIADAANALAALRNDPKLRPALPVREIVLAVLVALILTTLAFVRGLGGALPDLGAARVPPFTPAIERPAEPEPSAAELDASTTAPTVNDVLERYDRSAQARRDLQALAAALADHALTRPAAEQIARGDYAGAGDQLRDAAAQSSGLSQDARQELAGDLDQAAKRMDPQSNGLQEATRDAASGLRQGDKNAEAGMENLADAVEQTGQQVVPQGELAAQMRSARQAQAQQGGDISASSAQAGGASQSSLGQPQQGDPGAGADANSTSNASDGQRQSSQAGAAGEQRQPGSQSQNGDRGSSGAGNAPGNGQQPGESNGGQPGDRASGGERAGGMPGDADSQSAQQGGGAGTGEGVDRAGDRGPAGQDALSPSSEAAAAPRVSQGDGAEGDGEALPGGNQQLALPGGSGDQGVQTSSDGGSAMRGSGAGVTAGSGYATQGDVEEAGPDSNRVPPEHRDTVERYFSNGADQ
ncbi:MAG: hypothetical protein U0031_01775 [Thermomicrobiales bacterium]